MKVYLYDPRTNITTTSSYEKLRGMTELSTSSLSYSKSRRTKIHSINCYISDDPLPVKERYELYSKEAYPDVTWLLVEGSNNEFRVSNYGRIKRIYKKTERFMMPFQRKGKGNLHVKCRFLNEYKDHKVGHIVAHHFIRPRKNNE